MTLSGSRNIPEAEKANKLIFYFLLCWTILNAIQAYTLEIHADEAYYWLYSRFLDWGYFDHPPMVALFIRIGDSIVHSGFGLRLMTVLSSTLSLYILWLIVKKYNVEAKWFVLVVSSIFIFHIFGFMTTPDAPLFLFTILFYFVFQKYQQQDSLKNGLLLALIIAGLLYSKYHGILLVGFTVLSDLSLFRRKTFWIIAVVSTVLFIPHIIWQMEHGYPSINYHLFEQSSKQYKISQTSTYFPGQLLMAGPIIGWFLFYKAFTTRVKDSFIRCLMVNCIGTLLFFFASSLKGEVQPQWTLIAFVPLAMLTLIHFKQEGMQRKWVQWVAVANIALILVVRIAIITASPLIRKIGQVKSLYGFKEWANTIKQKVGDNYLIMNDGFQNSSKYDFYTNSIKGFAYDIRYYRLTQFDIWPIEDSLQHKKAYYLTKDPVKDVTTDTLNTTGGKWYGGWVNDVRTYQKVKVELSTNDFKASPGQVVNFDLGITNPYPYTINFSNTGYQHQVALESCLFKGIILVNVQPSESNFNQIELKPGENRHYTFKFTAPKEKGKYTVFFSLRTDPFIGSKNSRILNLTIE